MMWGPSRQRSRANREVVREAERMLEGRTIEAFIARRERVPAWSLISLLGHAGRFELIRLASPAARPDPNGWSGTMARLARDLLELTGDEPSLVRLQRQSLVPLELALLDGSAPPPASPAELYQMVSGAVERPLYPEL